MVTGIGNISRAVTTLEAALALLARETEGGYEDREIAVARLFLLETRKSVEAYTEGKLDDRIREAAEKLEKVRETASDLLNRVLWTEAMENPGFSVRSDDPNQCPTHVWMHYPQGDDSEGYNPGECSFDDMWTFYSDVRYVREDIARGTDETRTV